MKHIYRIIASVLLLLTVLSFPVKAGYTEPIYDETGLFPVDVMELRGASLVTLRDNSGIDLRVDLLEGLGDHVSLSDAAKAQYVKGGYGGEKGGISLVIQVHRDETGLAFDDYYVYYTGKDLPLVMVAAFYVRENVDSYMTPSQWVGTLKEDIDLLDRAIAAMTTGFISFQSDLTAGELDGLLANSGSASQKASSYDPDWMEHAPNLHHVTDNAGILDHSQCLILEEKAQAIEDAYGFGVYIITIKDFREYSKYDVFEAAVTLYKKHSLGTGKEKEGLLLLMSMKERDYSLITYSDRGNLTFSDEGRAAMTKFFLDDFREDRWYSGFWKYLDWSEKYLEAAEAGKPYDKGNLPLTEKERGQKLAICIGVILLLPLAVAGIWVWILTAKMKSVARQTQAAAYAQGGLTLTQHSDMYTHTTETRTRLPKSNGGSGRSGGSRSSRSGGFSGTSGKF